MSELFPHFTMFNSKSKGQWNTLNNEIFQFLILLMSYFPCSLRISSLGSTADEGNLFLSIKH